MDLNRRSFLQGLLGGAAVLTVGQIEAIEALLEMPPPITKTKIAGFSKLVGPGVTMTQEFVSKAIHDNTYITTVGHSLRWAHPVLAPLDLPDNDPEATARVTLEDDRIWVSVEGLGWIELVAKPRTG